MLIFNKYKNILEDLIDSLDIKYSAIPKKIDLLNVNILGSKNNSSDLKIDNDLLDKL